MGVLLTLNSLVGDDKEYSRRYKEADDEQKPLVILASADWCPGCKIIKPRLEKVYGTDYMYLDIDENGGRFAKLIAGGQYKGNVSIPHLFYFRKVDGQWRRHDMIGAKSEEEIRQLLEISNFMGPK